MTTDFDDALQALLGVPQQLSADAETLAEPWPMSADFTLFGGFGGDIQRMDELIERADQALSRFSEGELHFDLITSGTSGDLGYAVGVERGRVVPAGREDSQEFGVRVTHLFRREDGEWKLLHRHADVNAERIPMGGGF